MYTTNYNERKAALSQIRAILSTYSDRNRIEAQEMARLEQKGLVDKYHKEIKWDMNGPLATLAATWLTTTALFFITLKNIAATAPFGVLLLLLLSAFVVPAMAAHIAANIVEKKSNKNLGQLYDIRRDENIVISKSDYEVQKMPVEMIGQAFTDPAVSKMMQDIFLALYLKASDLNYSFSAQGISVYLDKASEFALLNADEQQELICDLTHIRDQLVLQSEKPRQDQLISAQA